MFPGKLGLSLRWLIPALACSAALTAAEVWLLRLDWVLTWLAAVNITTLAIIAYDKAAAEAERVRVPEVVLLVLTITGGALGALIGMLGMRHKVTKISFQFKFWLVAWVPVLILLLYLLRR